MTQLARNQGLNLEATTVAKLLKLQPVIDVNTGQQLFEFIQEKELELTDYDVIILDEYSMLSKESFQNLQKAIYGSDTQIIFMGDSQQLPPVKEKEPIVARHPDIKRSSNLTQVVRYDGEIASVAETIRSQPQWNRQTYPFQTSQDGTIVKLNSDKWFQLAVN